MLLLSVIDLLTELFSEDSVASNSFEFLHFATALLITFLAFLGVKVTFGGLKSMEINTSGSNKSMQLDMMNI